MDSSTTSYPDVAAERPHHANVMMRKSSSDKRRAANWEDLVGSLSRSYNEKISQALQQHEYNFVLSDPRLPDHPIVYASEGFLRMCGYEHGEVLGRNCRFLQGPDTDRRTVLEIRDAIREERPCQVRILNYTKQGTPFWNLFHMAPVYSSNDGSVIHFVGVQTPIASTLAAAPAPISKLMHEAADLSAKLHDARHEHTQSVHEALTHPQQTAAGDDAQESISISNDDDAKNGDACGRQEPEQTAVNLRLRGGAEEDTCTVNEADKERAASAVKNVTRELTQSSRVQGALAQSPCMGLAQSAAGGVVCSSLMLSLTRIQQSFVLADPNLPDVPIVHASDVFCELTGYSREEVVGRNCRFLQGPDTDPEAVQQIREAIEGEQPCTVRILNYRKDGTPFWNHLHVAPVRSAGGKVAFYVGVQLDVSQADAEEVCKRGMSAHVKQLGAVGVVRVAVRSLQGSGLRRTLKRT